MATVDRLITEFGAIDKFTPVARSVGRAADEVARHLSSLHSTQSRLSHLQPPIGGNISASGILSLLSQFNPINLILTGLTVTLFAGVAAGTAFAGILTMIARRAVSAASEMQSLEATLTAVTGSAERAAEKMAFLRRFATESVFEFKDLARAGTLLEAFGLRMERMLPIIARLGAVFGANAELIDQLASAVGRIAAGQFGEAMEILRRFGIGAQALREAGVEIDKSGQVKSSAEQVLRAIERIVMTRFGSITQLMSTTLVVQLSNLRDTVFQIFETIGRAILPHVQKVASVFAELVSNLRELGGINLIAESFAKAASVLSSTLISVLPRALAWLQVLLTNAPQLFAAVWESSIPLVRQLFTAFESLLESIANGIITLNNNIANLFNHLRRFIPFLRALPEMATLTLFRAGLSGIGISLYELFRQFRTEAEMIETLLRRDTGRFDGQVPTGEAAGSFWGRQQQLTEEIATNTRTTVELLKRQIDFQRVVLGGGEIASLGLTPVERARLTRTEVARGAENFIEEIVRRMMRLQVIRQR